MSSYEEKCDEIKVKVIIKILSGDLIQIEVNKNITYKQLYQKVYNSLPQDLCPNSIWQLNLSRVLENGDYEDFKEIDEAVFEKEIFEKEIMLFCVLNEHNYTVGLGRDYDAYENTLVEEKDFLFELRSIELYSWDEQDYYESYLYHPHTNKYYLIDDVVGEMVGRFKEEFLFDLPKDSKEFFSFSDLLDHILNRIKIFGSRTKEHIKTLLINKFDRKYRHITSEDMTSEDMTSEDYDNEEEQWYAFRDEMRRG
jgi:hypothetical protein